MWRPVVSIMALLLGGLVVASAAVPPAAVSAAAPNRDRAPAASPNEPWPDTFTVRLAALALLQTLETELLSQDSATLTLEHWCAAHRLAAPAKMVATRVLGEDKPVTAQLRQDLAADSAEPIRYRRVQLRCGERVLSEADNWYVPARLTPAMNAQLDGSDTPFGKVVRELHFQRHTLAAAVLWSPLPEGWEMSGAQRSSRSHVGGVLTIPREVLRNRALLTLPSGVPFSEVVETYTARVLDFPPPNLP